MPEVKDKIASEHRIILCLGSNSGDRENHIRSAVDSLSSFFVAPAQMSDLYETPCCKGIGAPYLNTVLYAVTWLTLEELCEAARLIERNHGRTSESKYTGIVPLDIDVVVADSSVLRPHDMEQHYFQLGYSQLAKDGISPLPIPERQSGTYCADSAED